MRKLLLLSFSFAISLTISAAFWSWLLPGAANVEAEARRHHASSSRQEKTHHGRAHGLTGRASHRGKHHARIAARHHESAARKKHVLADNKHAYAVDFFMMRAPELDSRALDEDSAGKIRDAFARGIADSLPADRLVRAGVFKYHPLSGGIFKRRQPVKYIVLHSTETGIPVPGKNVINGWNSLGRRHAGAQFVVDRDGTIYLALDPELASVHVNIFKTLPGINNDNTIGIEMNHTGRQGYPAEELRATTLLVTYLQQRFNIDSENVITHRYAQQGDHTDPVLFNMDTFLAGKENVRIRGIALKRSAAPLPFDEETEDDAPLASVYVQIHGMLSDQVISSISNGRAIPGSHTDSACLSAQQAKAGHLSADAMLAMPRGTYVAGGRLRPGSSPDSENEMH